MAKSSKSSSASSGTDAASILAVGTARRLAEVLTEHDLSELVMELPGLSLTLRRGGVVVASHLPAYAPAPAMTSPFPGAAPAAAPGAAAAPVDDGAHVVTCPFVGTFYRKPNPDAAPFVNIGERVEKGQALCIVEAMKLMNEIEADASGVLVAVLVEDGAVVQYGQALFKIQ